MPRYARLHVTGGMFHVISRFHDRRFYLDLDGAREKYLELLGKACEKHDSRIVAYCLMSSHVHLVLQLGNDSLGSFVKRVHSPFGGWVNANRNGLGTILADRPKSVLVHTESHGLELVRYVHNNPVRAGVVETATQSSWSSHRAYMGLQDRPSWLATDAILGTDEKEREAIRHDFGVFVDEGRLEVRRPEFSGDVSRTLARQMRRLLGGDVILSYPVLGPDTFVLSALKEQAQHHQDRQQRQTSEMGVERIIAQIFDRLGLDPNLAQQRIKPSRVARARALVAWLWVIKMGRPQVMVAEGLGMRPTTVSKMISSLRKRGLTYEEVQLIDNVLGALTITDSKSTAGNSKPLTDSVGPSVLILKRNRLKDSGTS